MDENETSGFQAKIARSECILNVSKVLQQGVELRHVKEALEKALEKWQPRNLAIAKTFA
jgi:Holliday junction resolvasome RuvABC endonuclease subunit